MNCPFNEEKFNDLFGPELNVSLDYDTDSTFIDPNGDIIHLLYHRVQYFDAFVSDILDFLELEIDYFGVGRLSNN